MQTPLEFHIGHWFFSIFLDPHVWGLAYHRNAQCCKFWLLIGPFEINRVWTDDEYPFPFEDEDGA